MVTDNRDAYERARLAHEFIATRLIAPASPCKCEHSGLARRRRARCCCVSRQPTRPGSEARGRALADIAIAAHDGELAGEHHVGGALDAVDEALATSVEVVDFGLGHALVALYWTSPTPPCG